MNIYALSFLFGLNAQVPVVGATLVRALLVGGNVNNGRNAGARYCNVNNAPSNSNWNYCAAQSFGIANLFFGAFFPMPLSQRWEPAAMLVQKSVDPGGDGRIIEIPSDQKKENEKIYRQRYDKSRSDC